MELVSTQKNKGIMTILEQTHKYLERLGAKVMMQKNEKEMQIKKQAAESKDGEDADMMNANLDEELEAARVDAYGNRIDGVT